MQDLKLAYAAMVIVAVVAAGAALSWGGPILTPLVLAMFLLVMIDGLARTITERIPRLPAWAALPLALAIAALVMGITLYVVVNNAAGFANELIGEAPRISGLIGSLGAMMGIRSPQSLSQLMNQFNPAQYLGNVAWSLQAFGGGAAAVVVYMGFLIASRSVLPKKVQALFPDEGDRGHATAVFQRIRGGVERYLWIQTITGLMIAACAWGLMALVGLSNALFWAFLIFVAAYVPVIGGAVGTILPPLFALVQFPSIWPAAFLFIGLEVVMLGIGSVVQPRMQRDSLNIDPVVILLSLALWGALWGAPGLFLATPLTATAIIILAQFEASRWLAVLLSADGAPEREPPLTHPRASRLMVQLRRSRRLARRLLAAGDDEALS